MADNNYRIEARPRKKESISRTLKAEIHDPLWMLTRQWQFGEFRGEDAGSSILARVKMKSFPLTHLQLGSFTQDSRPTEASAPISFSEEMGLEAIVESRHRHYDYKTRVQAARYWINLLTQRKVIANNARQEFRLLFQKHFPFRFPEINEVSQPELTIEKAKILANPSLSPYLATICRRSFDGVELLKALQSNDLQLPEKLLEAIAAKDESIPDKLSSIIRRFIHWFEDSYGSIQQESQPEDAWNPRQLEYQMAIAFPEEPEEGEPDSGSTILVADEYYHGRLDWYAFDLIKSQGLLHEQAKAAFESLTIEPAFASLIPSPASFPGMPSNRYWEFEDGKINYSKLQAGSNEAAKVIIAQYASIYGNDWQVIPLEAPVGSLNRIEAIIVTDVFGIKKLITPLEQAAGDNWTGFGLFNHASRKNGGQEENPRTETGLFLVPSIGKVQESEPIEQVQFFRDEVANLVWAIENRVPNGMGGSAEGQAMAAQLSAFLEKLDEDNLPSRTEASTQAALKYYLATNEMPENWIPFIAAHVKESWRAIQLQRASLPRYFQGRYLAIRPRTALLRAGLPAKARPGYPVFQLMEGLPPQPYFINEEEVPRGGMEVRATYQRARWYNGKVINWYGNRKQFGFQAKGGQLLFDMTEAEAVDSPARTGGQPRTLHIAPTLVRLKSDAIAAFLIDTEGAVWQGKWKGGWKKWAKIGGTADANFPPSIIQLQPGQFNVFVKSIENQVLHIASDGQNWGPWGNLGGHITNGPTALTWGDNKIDLFARSEEGHIIFRRWDGNAWGDWQNLGSKSYGVVLGNSSIEALNRPTAHGRIEVFFTGKVSKAHDFNSMGRYYLEASKGRWIGPNKIPREDSIKDRVGFSGPPKVVIRETPALEFHFFVRGNDGAIWYTYQDQSRETAERWGSWQSLGGQLPEGSRPAVLYIFNGWMYLFARNTDNQLMLRKWEQWQWSDWQTLEGEHFSDPAAVQWNYHEIHLFTVDGEGAVQRTIHPIPELLRDGSPTLIQFAPGQIESFTVNKEGRVLHYSYFEDGRQTKVDLGGTLIPLSSLAATQYRGSLYLFGRGLHSDIWYRSWEGANWSAWESLGGTFTSDPSAAVWAGGFMDIYARAKDGSVAYRRWQNGQWEEWNTIGDSHGFILPGTEPFALETGTPNAPVHVFFSGRSHKSKLEDKLFRFTWRNHVQTGDIRWIGPFQSPPNNIDDNPPPIISTPVVARRKKPDDPNLNSWHIFGQGEDGKVWYTSYDDRREGAERWAPWNNLQGQMEPVSELSAVALSSQKLFVFVRSLDQELHYREHGDSGWSAWQSLGGELAGSPSAIVDEDGGVQVVVRWTDGSLRRRRWMDGQWKDWGADLS